MGIQFEQITYESPFSLTQLVEDTALLRQQGAPNATGTGPNLEGWLNAVQRQNRPLIQSEARRADLEAWLEAAELATASPSI
jgi:hypothetical protein